MSNISIGRLGEQIASNYLLKRHIHIREYNFRTKLGEIDIIAEKDGKLLFIEVKTRVGDLKGKPYEAVDRRKILHMKRAAESYILQKNQKECKLSLQVISIELNKDLSVKKVLYFEDLEV